MTPTQFLELFFSVSLQAAVVVTAAHWIGRLVDDERTQCQLWTACFSLLLLLVANALVFPHVRLFQPMRPLTKPLAAGIVSLELQAGRVLFWGWLAGCVVSLGLFVYRSIMAEKFLRTCRPVDPDVISLSAVISPGPERDAFQVDRQVVQLVSSPAVTSAFCWQFHKPYIVIPDSLLTYQHDQLRFILRHELAHLKTGHPMQVFLQRTVEIVFWFHPMVWWSSRESALAREFVCDDMAVETRSDIVAYLKTLLTIAEQNVLTDDPQVGSLAFVRNPNLMAERARRLVGKAQQPSSTDGDRPGTRFLKRSAPASLIVMTLLTSLLWLPVNVLASPAATWSPWPTWTAHVLHDFGLPARDFEVYDAQYTLHEVMQDQAIPTHAPSSPAK